MPRPRGLDNVKLSTGEQIRNLLAAVAELYDTLEEVKETLYGKNSQPGMDEIVRQLQSAQVAAIEDRVIIKNKLDEMNSTMRELTTKHIERRETRLLNIKMSAETRSTILQGLFTLAGIVLATLIARP